MKFRSFLFGSAVVAMLGITAVGCNDNPVVNANAPAAVTNLKAVSLSATSVGLQWTASTGATSYLVSWKGQTAGDSASVTVTATTTPVTVTTGQAYVFTVQAVNTDGTSAGTTVTWAPADRFTSDAATSTTIRIYEKASTNGSGLVLDPALGGPKNISVIPTSTAGSVQLAIFAAPGGSTFSIGPAFAFDEYKNGGLNNFYSDITVSRTTFIAPSLDTWYSNTSIENELVSADSGSTVAYTLSNSVSGSNGQGFFVRTGVAGAYHYARVFVKNVGGQLLQGTAGNRFVELEISYQKTAGIPYAKVAPSMFAPRGVAAHKLSF
jgi:hypothetical protein